MDQDTETALQSFQSRAGLVPLGIVDDATWDALRDAAALAGCADCAADAAAQAAPKEG